jgi:hypothetical protein
MSCILLIFTDEKYCILSLDWFHCIPVFLVSLLIQTSPSTITDNKEFLADHHKVVSIFNHGAAIPSQESTKRFSKPHLLSASLIISSTSESGPISHQRNHNPPLPSYINQTGYLLSNLINVGANKVHITL